MPEPPENPYAAQGTLLHKKMEMLLDTDQTPEVLRGDLDDNLIDDKLWPAYHGIQEFMQKWQCVDFDLELRYERKLEGCWGTLDFVGKGAEGQLLVADFKFGEGEKERAFENYQLAFYTLGLYDNDDEFIADKPFDIVFAIVQPWRGEEDMTLDEWQTNAMWLEMYRRQELVGYEKSKAGSTELKVGRWCKWCKARPVCPEHTSAVVTFAEIEDTRVLDTIKAAELLEMGKRASEAYKSLVSFVEQEVVAGRMECPPGYKVVESFGNREWTDEKTAKQALIGAFGVDAFEKRILSPAKAEKLAKRQNLKFDQLLGDFVARKSRGARLAPSTDRRPEVTTGTMQVDAEIKNLVPLKPIK